ncbi:MAG: hypothetical protein LBS30_03640 [Planctomycetota bacterium]|jgi:flagellar basal-body rod modification protein FlgD|nr:hypothetical protein [Planctomycetota bacterium]
MSAIEYGIDTSTAYQRQQAAKADASSVSHDQFLTLLTTQLQNQDPLNPMQDIDFTAQLAQLNALEEQISMTKTMKAMRIDTQFQAGTAMIGKYVYGTDTAGATATGMVVRVSQDSDGVYVELANKQKLEVSNINNVWNDATGMYNDLSSSGNVIGMWVEAGLDAASQPVRGIVEKIQVENGQVRLKLYGGQTVTWDQVTELRVPTDDELWYTLPDAVRAKVESAQKMVNKGVTGKGADGKAQNGIVAGAELEGSTVYLILYNGDKINLDTVTETRKPTADDAAKSLKGYWVQGLARDGSDLSGVVAGAGEDDSGMYMVLDTGQRVYFDTISEIRNAEDGEKNRLVGLTVEGTNASGEPFSGIVARQTEVDGVPYVELEDGTIVPCENIEVLRNSD